MLLLALALVILISVPDVKAAQRPNFVVVQTDDMALRLMADSYLNERGRRVPIMPRLMSLFGEQGRDFRNTYTASAICSPSRASFFSGQMPHNHEVVVNAGRYGGWRGWLNSPAMETNLATVLDGAGYHTAHFGKWINQYGEDPVLAPAVVPPGWDVWATDATDQSTRDYYGYFQLVRNEREGISDQILGPFGSQTYSDNEEIDPASCNRPGEAQPCNYHGDRMNLLAVDELREAEEPFFVMVNHHGPHSDNSAPIGAQPATRHIGLASGEPLPKPPNFNERNTSDKDFLMRRFSGRLDEEKTRITTKIWQRGIESLQAIDEGIGQMHEALEEAGRLANTYFIFTSDNGMFHGEHRFAWSKGLPYEEATKVPLLIAGPGIEPGQTTAPVAQLDLTPTIFDLADLNPAGMRFDGRTLRPFLEGGSAPQRAVLIERIAAEEVAGDPAYPPFIPITSLSPGRPPNKAPTAFYRGLRIGPYKYARFDSGGEELYDLRKDPFELYDQSRSPGYEAVLGFMRDRAATYRDCRGQECLTPPGQPPEAGQFLTDARRPPTTVGSGIAYLYGQDVFASLRCPTDAVRACSIEVDARRGGTRLTGRVRRTVAPGARVRVALPVLPSKENEVLRRAAAYLSQANLPGK